MIRRLEISEIDSIMEIWLQCNINAHDFISKDYWIKNYEHVKEILPQSKVLVYEDNHRIKGFIGIIDKSYIAGLFVSSKYQCNGIGSKLIEECKKYYPILKLDVYAKNLKAIEFYKKHGFKIEIEKENDDTKDIEYLMIWKSKE